MTYRPERAEQVAFSDPYQETAVPIAMRNDKKPIRSKEELLNMTLGAEVGAQFKGVSLISLKPPEGGFA